MTPTQLQVSLLAFAAGAASVAVVSWLWRRRAAKRASGRVKPPKVAGVSLRGAHMLQPILPYLEAHLDATLKRPYDREERPDGMISLCIAENRLGWAFLEPHLAKIPNPDGNVANYGEPRGSEEFRQAIAGVMTKFMLQAEHLSLPESEKPPKKVVVDAEDIVVNAGVSAILHHLSMCLFDEGETILVVAPCYPAFFYDPVVQARLDMVPVVMQPNEAEVSKELLETAMADAKEEGKRVKGIMITTPTNPSGEVLTKDELLTVIDFAERHDLHLISDEVYALSMHAPGIAHLSVAHLRPTFGSKIHVIWGLSKDLCASGARVGVLWTQNEAFKSAMGNVSILTWASNFAQYAFTPLLSNDDLMKKFFIFNAAELRKMYGKVTTALQSIAVSFTPAQGGMFLWLDLRELLAAPAVDSLVGWTAEEELTEDMIKSAGIVLTPGKPFRTALPGFYRLCFAWNKADVTEVGIERFVTYVQERRERIREMDPVRKNLFKRLPFSSGL